jgi:hypothetical protein
MTRTPFLALGALLLTATGLAGIADPATAAVGTPTVRVLHKQVETGKKAVLVGQVPGAAGGTKVIVQDRFSPRQLWLTVGHATVHGGGKFRYTQLIKRSKNVYFRVCTGPKTHRRCSSSVRQRVLRPDGDPKLTVTKPAAHPGDPMAPFSSSPDDPAKLTLTTNDDVEPGTGATVQLRRDDGLWLNTGTFQVEADGSTDFTVSSSETGRAADLRVLLAASDARRQGVSNTVSAQMWAIYYLQKFQQIAGNPVTPTHTVDLIGINAFINWMVVPSSGSATFATPDHCQTMYVRAGLVPAGQDYGDQRHVTVSVDGVPVLDTNVAYQFQFSGNPKLVVPLTPGVHQVTLTDAAVPMQPGDAAAFDARFDCLNGPPVVPTF